MKIKILNNYHNGFCQYYPTLTRYRIPMYITIYLRANQVPNGGKIQMAKLVNNNLLNLTDMKIPFYINPPLSVAAI
jgi:hypothetical protein